MRNVRESKNTARKRLQLFSYGETTLLLRALDRRRRGMRSYARLIWNWRQSGDDDYSGICVRNDYRDIILPRLASRGFSLGRDEIRFLITFHRAADRLRFNNVRFRGRPSLQFIPQFLATLLYFNSPFLLSRY